MGLRRATWARSRLVSVAGDERLAGGDGADALDQLFGRRPLQQEAVGTGLERVVHDLVEIEGGEHQDTWPRLRPRR